MNQVSWFNSKMAEPEQFTDYWQALPMAVINDDRDKFL